MDSRSASGRVAHESRPGDWYCQKCNQLNFQSRQTCIKGCVVDDEDNFHLMRVKAFHEQAKKKQKRDVAENPLVHIAREIAEEKRKHALAECQRSRKLLVCGDVRGRFEQVFTMAEAQDKKPKVGPFEAIFCVGAFMPETENSCHGDAAAAYLRGERDAPRDCYFIDTSPALLQAAPKGMTLGKRLHFLGAYGIRKICGLHVAYLSGHYDAAVYDTVDIDFLGGAYTKRVVSKLRKLVADSQYGVDVLLTAGWPANITDHLTDASLQPPQIANAQSWELFCAPPISELCQFIEPRYHIFACADVFYQRPPFQTTHRGHTCRCIALGAVGSPLSKQQKWIHALALSPMEYMSIEELKKQPDGSTACPFTEGVGQQDVCVAAHVVSNESLFQQTLSSLAQGDSHQYLAIAEKLHESKFVCS